jgi:hypothetical protein
VIINPHCLSPTSGTEPIPGTLEHDVNERKYPMTEFKAFVQSARRYIEITVGEPMIHTRV